MSNNKQSSVDWLFDELARINFEYATSKITPRDFQEQKEKIKQQAKAMHKKEILESYRWGRYDSDKLVMSERFYREQYYEQTFGGNNGNNNSN